MLKLKPKQVFLDRRMIFLPDPKKIKERKAKRIPIHRDLHPILERLLEVNPAECELVFMISDEDGTRPVTKNTVESAFRRMFKVLDRSHGFPSMTFATPSRRTAPDQGFLKESPSVSWGIVIRRDV